MLMNALILLCLALSLGFALLAVLGMHVPRLGLAPDRRTAFHRNGLLALLCYALMAIFLSVKVIDQRGYDARFAQDAKPLSPAASAWPARPARADAGGTPSVPPGRYS